MRSVALSLFAPVAVSLCAGTASAGDPFEWPASAGGNGHWYQVVGIDFGTRDEARALAQAQGAELVSFGGLAESNFVQARVLAELPIGSEMALGGYQDPTAPGYSEPNGGWRWFDATPWVFSKWDVGICSPTQLQPDDNSGADRLFARICGAQLVWFDDIASRQVAYAIFEWSADCNGDGVIDYGQVFYADADGDGFGFGEPLAPGECGVLNNEDCDDAMVMWTDADGDGFGVAPMVACGGVGNDTDCDDTQFLYADNDGDGFGAGAPAGCGVADSSDCDDMIPLGFYTDADGDGFGVGEADQPCGAAVGGDCDDTMVMWTDADGDGFGVAPMVPCDGVDNDSDCDDAMVMWTDADGDGFGVAPVVACGGVGNDADCDDALALGFYTDADGDGFGVGEPDQPCGAAVGGDCDDALALGFYTDADGDGFGVGEPDQPCGVTVGGDCDDTQFLYADNDGDGFGAGAATACGVPDNTDCDDTQFLYADNDGDGFGAGAPVACGISDNSDCDDAMVLWTDADGDGFGVAPMVACDGVDNDTDCDDTQLLYADGDGDTFGAGAAAACGVPTDDDCNDSDPSIYPGAPELCDGIDQNCDGNADDIDGDGILDCVDVDVVMQVFDGGVVPGGTMIVRVSADTVDTIDPLLGLQTAIRFDASRLAVTSVTPVAGSPLPQEIIPAIVDNAAGTLLYALGAIPGSDPLTGDADLFDIEFAVLPDADACAPGVVLAWFEPEASTFFVDGSGDALVPGLISLEATDLDVLPPVISGVPSVLTVPTDAGTTFGAFIDEPSVTADDACTDSTLDISITYPGGSVVDAWPASGMFPQGTSTVLWTARDAGGNESTASWTITVEDYQLLDATIRIQGAFDDTQSSFSRCITISADGLGQSSQCVTFETLSKLGTVSGLVVSPAVEVFPCITAKDTPLCDSCECAGHSITDLGDVTIVGSRYSADFFLLQGNSNDDETIDVLDYGLWFIDFGDPGRCGRSNFNADDVVSSADFAWISINFFATGESCGGGDFNGAAPVTRISVKELRRRGLGELAEADVNGDGWLDMRDVQHVMQFGVPQPFSAE